MSLFLYKLKYATYKLKKIQKKFNQQQRLNFLIKTNEQSVGLQKISFNPNLNFNTPIFKQGSPFFFARKNFKILFWNILQKGFLTPNLLKFLHIAYWPTNYDKFWRTFYLYHGLERKQRINFIQPKISKLSYFFSLIFKKNYLNNLLYFKSFNLSNSKQRYFNKLKYLYHLNINKLKFQNELDIQASVNFKRKKKIFIITNIFNKFRYLKTPKFILKKRIKKEFKDFFFLTFRQRSFLKNLINFYFPVLSIFIKEHNIHSLPMKTKKPRRV